MIVEIAKVKAGEDPGATGVHETDCRSFESARVPSFFLYDAEPVGGAILKERQPNVAMHMYVNG